MLVAFAVIGVVPAIVRAVAHPTPVIAALDLWLVVASRPWQRQAGAAVDVAPACLWAALGAACAVAAARLLVRARPPLTASA